MAHKWVVAHEWVMAHNTSLWCVALHTHTSPLTSKCRSTSHCVDARERVMSHMSESWHMRRLFDSSRHAHTSHLTSDFCWASHWVAAAESPLIYSIIKYHKRLWLNHIRRAASQSHLLNHIYDIYSITSEASCEIDSIISPQPRRYSIPPYSITSMRSIQSHLPKHIHSITSTLNHISHETSKSEIKLHQNQAPRFTSHSHQMALISAKEPLITRHLHISAKEPFITRHLIQLPI